VGRRLFEVGKGPAALWLHTDDIKATARRTGRRAHLMSRIRPDGVELAWHLLALDAAIAEGLPFFVQWQAHDGVSGGSLFVSDSFDPLPVGRALLVGAPPSASHGLRLRRNGPRSRRPLTAQGRCQRALTIFHPSRVRTNCRYST
jgi:Glyoxalase-like domain